MKSFTSLTWKLTVVTALIGSTVFVGHAQQPAPTPTTRTGPVLEQRHPRYALERDDVILLTFPLSPELNQTVTVQPDGYINLQSAGSVYVQGMTVPDLVSAVKGAYKGILHEPIVEADLTDFKKPFVTVSGQVAKPGQYDLRGEMTIAEALAVAGGTTTSTAKTQIFLFHKTSDGMFEVKKVNLKPLFQGKDVTENATLQPGDMVYVPEKFIANFRKYVPYSISAGSFLQQGLP